MNIQIISSSKGKVKSRLATATTHAKELTEVAREISLSDEDTNSDGSPAREAEANAKVEKSK